MPEDKLTEMARVHWERGIEATHVPPWDSLDADFQEVKKCDMRAAVACQRETRKATTDRIAEIEAINADLLEALGNARDFVQTKAGNMDVLKSIETAIAKAKP